MIGGVNEMKSQFHESSPTVSCLPQLLPLHLLARGESAEIDQLIGQAEQVHRLEELGLRSGVRVEMIQPGSPCIIRTPSDQRLCFRDTEMFGILVRQGESL
jgi:ferrous iron transport protein A